MTESAGSLRQQRRIIIPRPFATVKPLRAGFAITRTDVGGTPQAASSARDADTCLTAPYNVLTRTAGLILWKNSVRSVRSTWRPG
jgi:hypothetical protein